MGFLFPLFLIAAIAIAIPILIHLFNLRKYKKMDFPTLRFLNALVIQNKKMSQVQKKWLLIARILTLVFLVLAFAQPFFKNKNSFNSNDGLSIIYIDNSMSMEHKIGQQDLLDKAKQTAIQFVQQQSAHEFFIISNDNLFFAQPISKSEAVQAIQKLQLSSVTIGANDIQHALVNIQEQQFNKSIRAIIFSDFQQNLWTTDEPIDLHDHMEFVMYPIVHDDDKYENILIDTAYLAESPVDIAQELPLITHIKKIGTAAMTTTLATKINGQTIQTKNITLLESDTLLVDTTFLQLSGGKWNHITQSIESRATTFDDRYNISAEIAPAMNILILNEQGSNAYVTNALAAQQGIHPLQQKLTADLPAEVAQSLIVLNGITQLSTAQATWILQQLSLGKSMAIIFDKNANISSINNALKEVVPIAIQGVDTSFQQIVDLQSSHPLLQGVLSQIPANIQLPFAQYSYQLKAGITAAGQDVMRYRNGLPFISQYNIAQGKLYIFATPLTPSTTNLVASHYFAPIMYKMAINSNAGNVFSAEIAPHQFVWIQNTIQEDKQVYHLRNDSIDVIPKQQSKGIGTNIVIPEHLYADGFYSITYENARRHYDIGLNYNRAESDIRPATTESLKHTFSKGKISVIHNLQQLHNYTQAGTAFPWWKIATILALMLLIIETYLIWKPSTK